MADLHRRRDIHKRNVRSANFGASADKVLEGKMSNQVGDRYACSDPSCGCEMEITAACAAGQDEVNVRRDYSHDAAVGSTASSASTSEGSGGTGTASLGHSLGGANAPEDRGFRTEGLATSSVSGAQGATGEGNFGTVASGGSDHVHTEGRYGSHLPRKTRTAGDASQLGSSAEGESSKMMSASPTCFCGSKMREVGEGSGVGKSFAAGV